SSLLAQHRFPEALEAARRLNELAPAEPGARALLGEIQLELGDYDAARKTFAALASERRHLAVAPRLARWAEIQGHTAEAGHLLRRALTEAVPRRDLALEQVAWFYLRLGDFELRHGRLGEAEWVLRAGLEARPDDPRLLAARARLEALRQRWPQAIAYGERAGAGADLATLALIGDGYAALGDSARAEAYYAAVERAAAERPEPFNRQWTQFRLEHGWRVPETLALLSAEIAVRRDVYGYDQLAWALHLAGEDAAAREAMTQALRMGTRDAVLFFHAGMIERALGNRAAARRYLREALAINPLFHPTYPAVARAALAESPLP
ncbi:MAG: tetratricopeptide repeat protein, partial [Gemmatimonadales bacterium]